MDYVQLLLAHGGNPNLESLPPDRSNTPSTPLIKASATRLESVRLLVESGADVNHVTAIGYSSALDNAFIHENLDILEYLIFDKKANYNIVFNVTIQGDTLRIANMLRRLVYPLDSKEYLGKMELVHYLEARGIDCHNAPVPKHYYQSYSKEYLDQY